MALELTPSLAGKSLIASGLVIIVSLIFQIYMMYLNWKQSKVKDTQEAILSVLEEIREKLPNKN